MELYQSVGFLLFGTRLKRLSETFLSDVNRLYKQHKIRFEASWFPVFYLLSEKGEVSIREISDALHISHSAASQMVSSLQGKKLVKSSTSKKDARHKVVTFTSKGEKLLQQVLPVWKGMQKAMEELANESGDSKRILKALTAIENNIEHTTVFDRIEAKLNQ